MADSQACVDEWQGASLSSTQKYVITKRLLNAYETIARDAVGKRMAVMEERRGTPRAEKPFNNVVEEAKDEPTT